MGTTRKAFIFSLDAFVAFVLTIAALYTLIFFSTVPSAYYSSLMQTNYLAKDTLIALSTTTHPEGGTYLDYIVSQLPENDEPARIYVGALVPRQFGYKIEVLEEDDLGNESWTLLYDTADDEESPNKKEYHKMKAAAHSMFFGFESGNEMTHGENPYGYITCGGDITVCDLPGLDVGFQPGEVHIGVVRFTVYT